MLHDSGTPHRLNKDDLNRRVRRQKFAAEVAVQTSNGDFKRPQDWCEVPVDLKRIAEVDSVGIRDLDPPALADALRGATWPAVVRTDGRKQLSERCRVVRAADVDGDHIAKAFLTLILFRVAPVAERHFDQRVCISPEQIFRNDVVGRNWAFGAAPTANTKVALAFFTPAGTRFVSIAC
jgi:hypothetical protein